MNKQKIIDELSNELSKKKSDPVSAIIYNKIVEIIGNRVSMDQAVTIAKKSAEEIHKEYEKQCIVHKGKNEYGLDIEYFSKELLKLNNTLQNRNHGELRLYLDKLSYISQPPKESES